MSLLKVHRRVSEEEILQAQWKFIGFSKDRERIYYSPDGKERFSIYPCTSTSYVTNNNFIIKLWDKIFIEKP